MLFLNFFAIFLEFSITRWIGTKQNDNIYFLFSWPVPTYSGFKGRYTGIFEFFEFFCNFFVILNYASGRDGTKL